jgi:RNA polymerase sigma-70 factor (ECF subfamily)
VAITDDQVLAQRAAQEPDAFAVLYQRHVGAVYGFVYRSAGSREIAEDVTAAAFERAWRALGTFEWRGNGFRAWVMRIAATELADHYRRQQRDQRPRAQMALRELATVAADEAPIEATVETDLAALRSALATLRPRYQEVITMRYLSGLSTDDAAAALGCSPKTLAVVLHRAVRALRRAMADLEVRP